MSQQVFKMASFFIHTGLKSITPLFNNTVHSALRLAIPSVSQALPKVRHIWYTWSCIPYHTIPSGPTRKRLQNVCVHNIPTISTPY